VTAVGVDLYVEGCCNVMASLGLLDQPPEPSAVRWVVEDPRPNSGHMQRCYPAPAAGCFEAAVHLGQQVEPGQVLGFVVDPLGSASHEVRANEGGLVLVLRTFPSVQKGDSLVVILDTSYAIQSP
jgi:predicted deacylase